MYVLMTSFLTRLAFTWNLMKIGKRKTQPGAGENPPPTIFEGNGNEEAEEDEVESLVVSFDDSEEGDERSLVLSHALSTTLFRPDIPLSKEALGIFEKQNKLSQKFCLGKWRSSEVDSKIC